VKKLKAWLNKAQAKIAALIAAVGVALGVIHGVPAQTLTDSVTWTNPTTYTDGSAIVSADMKELRVQWGTSASGPFSGGQSIVAWPGTSAIFTRAGDGVGTRCYTVIAVTKAGAESDPGTPACKTINPPPPRPNKATNTKVE